MKTTYNDIEISYIEGSDTWEFELRGRSRSAPSLTKAKEAIDKVPAEKRAPFPKFDAYVLKYGGTAIVTVTSVAEKDYSGKPQFWVSENGRRSKERAYSLFPVNEHNTALIKELKEIEEAKNKLDEKRSSIAKNLQEATVPAECAE